MKIRHEKSKCIGCGSCAAVCEKYFEMVEENGAYVATLKGHRINQSGEEELVLENADDCIKEAADICPVQIIHIE